MELKFTAALNADTFPLVTRFAQRSVVIGQLDNKLKSANGGTKDGADNNPQNLPQVLYCENVMPTQQGVISTGFAQRIAGVGGTAFTEEFTLRTPDERTWLYSPANGLNYVAEDFGDSWTSTDPVAATAGTDVSVAYVDGRTFVLYPREFLLEWDGTSFLDRSGDLTGIAIEDIVAICGSINYLVAATEVEVHWSSLIDPVDFVPSDSTGAGVQIPVDLRGQINVLVSVPGGYLIGCEGTIVGASYTQNVSQPWIFRGVRNAGGLAAYKHITGDNNSGIIYAWTKNGFQLVNLRDAENLFPEITDFLAGKIYESFDNGTNILTMSKLTTLLDVKLGFVSGRYVTVSYGVTAGTYTYILVYDANLRRWGKIKATHTDCFGAIEGPRQSLCTLSANGLVTQVIMDYSIEDADHEGVLILGRYQLQRTYNLCSQELEVEVLDQVADIEVLVTASYTGSGYEVMQLMTPRPAVGQLRKFQKQLEGKNLSYILKGTFACSTFMLNCTRGAKSS